MSRFGRAYRELIGKGPGTPAGVSGPDAPAVTVAPPPVDNGMLKTGLTSLQDPPAQKSLAAVAGSFIRSQVAERWITNITRNLSPELIDSYLNEATLGMLFEPFRMFEEMEEKCMPIRVALYKHKLKAASRATRISTPKFVNDPSLAKSKADYASYVFGQMTDWPRTVFNLLDGVGKGISAAEVYWQLGEYQGKPAITIPEMPWVNYRHLSYWWDKPQLQLFPDLMNRAYHFDIPDRKFVVFHHLSKSGHPARAGMLRPLAWIWLIYAYAMKDWATLSETFGVDVAHAWCKPNATQEQRNTILLHLSRLAARAGVFDEGTVVNLARATGTGAAPQEAIIKYCEEKAFESILGSTLATQAGEKGARSLGLVQQDETEEVIDWTCLLLSATQTGTALRWLMEFNFSQPGDNPVLEMPGANRRDLAALASVIQILVGVGAKIPEEWVHTMFDIPHPKPKGEDIAGSDDDESNLELILTAASGGGQANEKGSDLYGNPLTAKVPDGGEITRAADFGSVTMNQAQTAMDRILHQALREGQADGTFMQIVAPIQQLIARDIPASAMLVKLHALKGEIPTDKLTARGAQLLVLGELLGRWTANETRAKAA